MSKARDIADLGAVTSRLDTVGASDGALSNRNLIINGAMQVAQRGTSQTAQGYNSVDRWYLYNSGGTYSQETSGGPDGFSHYLKCAGATGSVIFAQAIELPATGNAGVFYNGQTITLSYYAKSTVAGDALDNPLSFRNSQTSTTNLVSIENDSTNNNVLTTSWAKYSKTYTIGVNVDPNNTCLVMQPRTRGAPSGDISITGVQLEVGDTATPFEHRSYGDELARCQRYYELVGAWNQTSQYYQLPAYRTRGSSLGFPVQYKVEKRASPSVTFYDHTGTVSGVLTQISNGTDLAIQYGPTGDKRGVYRTQHASNPVDPSSSAYGVKLTADAEL